MAIDNLEHGKITNLLKAVFVKLIVNTNLLVTKIRKDKEKD
jgi:hypothetical protein